VTTATGIRYEVQPDARSRLFPSGIYVAIRLGNKWHRLDDSDALDLCESMAADIVAMREKVGGRA
jgi:hypothetical protein